MPLGGIRSHNPNKRAAAESRLRPRDHWDFEECRAVNMFRIGRADK